MEKAPHKKEDLTIANHVLKLASKLLKVIRADYRGILVYNICLIGISNSVFDGATNKSVLNIERP